MNKMIDRDKLNKLKTANDFFDEKYGKSNTSTREEFESETLLLSIGELLKENRLKNHLTQTELAERTGLKRTYISKVEKGQTDMQVSNFFRLFRGLGMSLLDINKLFDNRRDDACLA